MNFQRFCFASQIFIKIKKCMRNIFKSKRKPESGSPTPQNLRVQRIFHVYNYSYFTYSYLNSDVDEPFYNRTNMSVIATSYSIKIQFSLSTRPFQLSILSVIYRNICSGRTKPIYFLNIQSVIETQDFLSIVRLPYVERAHRHCRNTGVFFYIKPSHAL